MKIKIPYISPYNLLLSFKGFGINYGDSIHFIENNVLIRAISYNNNSFLCCIKQKSKYLEVSFLNTRPDKEQIKQLSKQIQKLTNTLYNLKEFYNESKKDSILSNLISKLNGLKPPVSPSLFEAMIIAVTEQQLNISVAISIRSRLIHKFGDKILYNNKYYYTFPNSDKISRLSINDIHSMGFSKKKAEYMIEIAKKFQELKINNEELKQKDTEKCIKYLTNLRGFGRWSSEYVLFRGLNRSEVSLLSDAGVKKAICHYYFNDNQVKETDLIQLSETWGKHKGIAAFYLLFAYQNKGY
ncbi:MAG: DNA-3-methyladenine glycosylase 2 family protein [Candidatus Firestonebacteria bacterium]|nr:DNA-3-methyladenine glycosylase 2 family protein [Candidatus Firestonebacteria bacterium]